MIRYIEGNLFDSTAQAIVNTVNLQGVMGKGIALQFKKKYAENYRIYKQACESGDIAIGKLLVSETRLLTGPQYIINFPTKTEWRKPSEYPYIETGLEDLKRIISDYGLHSVALPPLGAGNGGLDWGRVKTKIEEILANVSAEIQVYVPNAHIREEMRAERVRLTPARAMMLEMLYFLCEWGEYPSEFSAEKVCYFLQRLGAGSDFHLAFKPHYYGPYSGKVRYVLHALNGSYITGYSAMDKDPFEPLGFVADGVEDVRRYIASDSRLSAIVSKCQALFEGLVSDYTIELMSTVDYIRCHYPDAATPDKIYRRICEWSTRKKRLFENPEHIALVNSRLESFFNY